MEERPAHGGKGLVKKMISGILCEHTGGSFSLSAIGPLEVCWTEGCVKVRVVVGG